MKRSVLPVTLLPAFVVGALGCSSDAADSTDPGGEPTDMTDVTEPADDEFSDDTLTEAGLVTGVNGTIPCDAFDSGFDGDELCILPAEPGTGLFMHVGPKDYDDPDEVLPYLVAPGDEPTENYLFNTTNDETVQFYTQHYRMRPGSHHLIINLLTTPVAAEGWIGSRREAGLDGIQIGGTQRSVSDFPPGGEIPPEDANLARPVPPNTGMAFELHHVNASDKPILREAWVNFMQTDHPEPWLLGGIFMLGFGMDVPPGATHVLNYTADAAIDPIRVHSLFGHRHANTDRFSVWMHRGGERTLIYEDYDWNEPAEMVYNSVVDNGVPDRDTLTPGGYNGIINLEPGDYLEWECEVMNRESVNLTFGNAVYTAEMCNLFGAAVPSNFEASPIWFAFPPLALK